MENLSRNILSLATGVALGGVLGILFAPQSGKKTRKDIKDKASDLIDQAVELKDSLMSTLSSATEEEKGNIKEYIAGIEKYIKELEMKGKRAAKAK